MNYLLTPEHSDLINSSLPNGYVHSDNIELIRQGTNLVLRDKEHRLIYRIHDTQLFNTEYIRKNLDLITELSSINIEEDSFSEDAQYAVSEPLGTGFSRNWIVSVWKEHTPAPDDFSALGEALGRFHKVAGKVHEKSLNSLEIFDPSERFERRLKAVENSVSQSAFKVLKRKVKSATDVYQKHIRRSQSKISHIDAHTGNLVINVETGTPEMIDFDGIALSSHHIDFLPAYINYKRFTGNRENWERFCDAYAINSGDRGVTVDEGYLDELSVIKETMMNTWLADHVVKHDASFLSELYLRLDSWDSDDSDRELWSAR